MTSWLLIGYLELQTGQKFTNSISILKIRQKKNPCTARVSAVMNCLLVATTFSNAGTLTSPFTEVVELSTAYTTVAYNFDLFHPW